MLSTRHHYLVLRAGVRKGTQLQPSITFVPWVLQKSQHSVPLVFLSRKCSNPRYTFFSTFDVEKDIVHIKRAKIYGMYEQPWLTMLGKACLGRGLFKVWTISPYLVAEWKKPHVPLLCRELSRAPSGTRHLHCTFFLGNQNECSFRLRF